MFPTLQEIFHLLPEFFLLSSSVFFLMVGVFLEKAPSPILGKRLPARLGSLFAPLLLSLCFLLLLRGAALGGDEAGFVFYFKSLLLLSSLLFFLLLRGEEWRSPRPFPFEFQFLLLLTILGYLLLLSSPNFLVFYLALELSSLTSYALAASRPLSLPSTEAGLKYFVLGSFASALLLLGLSLLYGCCGTLDFQQLTILLGSRSSFDDPLGFLLLVAVALIGSSLLFKLGLAPFHLWVPDVYDGSPFLVTAFFSTLGKIALFGVSCRLLCFVFAPLFPSFAPFLLLFALFSIGLGTLGALEQKSLKRFAAYSGIVHGGYLLLGLSTGTFFGLGAAALYLTVYVFLSLNFFSAFAALRSHRFLDSNSLASLVRASRADPLFSTQLALNLFSMAGMPPLAGFFSKFYLLLALLWSGFWFSSLFVLLLSVASAVYYLRLVRTLYFETFFLWSFPLPLSPSLSLVSSLSSAFNLFFILFQPAIFMFFMG